MSRLAFCLPAIVAACIAAGCSPTIRYPRLRHPGPAGYQRANAEAFDPYPLPDLGPPIDGGRPREFGIPRNEVERAQDFTIVQAARRGVVPTPAAAAVSAPIVSPAAAPVPSAAPTFVPAAPSVPTYTPPAPVVTPTMPVTPSAPYGQPSIRY